MNSLKMKMSVIFGVCHMTLGLVQKAANEWYFGRKNNFWHVFLPQIILLWAMFGYMDLLIVIKWNTNFTGHEIKAADIKSTMVAMFLGQEIDQSKFLFYTGQSYV